MLQLQNRSIYNFSFQSLLLIVSSFLHIIESIKLVVKECSHKSGYKRVSTLFIVIDVYAYH